MCRKDPATGKWINCRKRSGGAEGAPASAQGVPAPPSEVVVYSVHASGMDEDQVTSVYERSYERVTEEDGPLDDDLRAQWSQWCSQKAEDAEASGSPMGRELGASFRAMASVPPQSSREARAAMDIDYRLGAAREAMQAQTTSVANLHGVTPQEAEERISAYREQYLAMDEQDRPAPPQTWVTGFSTKDMTSVAAPKDPATLFAVYRAQADPNAFDSSRQRTFASIDLETAGPPGKDAFDPSSGSIIEVGVVFYDERGQEVGRYETLVHPLPDAEDTYRTGAVNIHGIEWEDVADAPQWSEVAPEVDQRLRGTTLVAQNGVFERNWLSTHMETQGRTFDVNTPDVDTMRMSRQHLDLPNHRLETICKEVGVDYDHGHRAMHDAQAAGRVFFALRDRIHQTWAEDPKRASLPQPERARG